MQERIVKFDTVYHEYCEEKIPIGGVNCVGAKNEFINIKPCKFCLSHEEKGGITTKVVCRLSKQLNLFE